MNNPLVSIIIPTYNRAHLISETLDSVLVQTYTNWECIIVDDGSTDNTFEVINSYVNKDARFQYHHRPTDRLAGGNAARNYGFEVSKGEYVNWFDDDDIMHPDKLLIQIKSLLKSEYKFSICQTLNFENEINNVYGLRPTRKHETDPFEAYLKEEFVVFTPSTVWEKSFLNMYTYKFDENLKASQEWEFYCNIFFNEKSFDYIEKPLAYIRFHNERISSSKPTQKFWYYYLARLIIYKKYAKVLKLDTKIFLVNYFISIYTILLKRREYKLSFKIFRVVFNTEIFNVKRKVYLSLSLIAFIVFKRGTFLISKLKL